MLPAVLYLLKSLFVLVNRLSNYQHWNFQNCLKSHIFSGHPCDRLPATPPTPIWVISSALKSSDRFVCIRRWHAIIYLFRPLFPTPPPPVHIYTREYWMFYREPSFLAFVRFGSSPTSFPLSLFSQSSCVSPLELAEGIGGGGWGGAKSYDYGKAWPSINHSHPPPVHNYTREYWIIYRGPSFLAFVRFGSSPTSFPPTSPVSKLSLFLSLIVCRRSSLLTGEGGRGGRGAKSYEHEKAWPSINHSILSDFYHLCFLKSTRDTDFQNWYGIILNADIFEDEAVYAFSSKAKPINKTGSKEFWTLSELDMIKYMNNRK